MSSLLALFIGSLAAYALARFQYKTWKNDEISFFILAQRLFPPIVMVAPLFIFFYKIHLLDTYLGLILVYSTMNLPLVIWLLRSFFIEIPVEIEEAAFIDGCSRMHSLIKIVFPLVMPGLVVTFLFCFIFCWNEFLFALTLTFDNAKTLPVYIAGNVDTKGPRYWDIAAQSMVMTMPAIMMVILASKYMVRELTFGALKG